MFTTETLGKELGKEQKHYVKVTNTMLKHYHDRRLLGWLDGEMAPPPPAIVLDKQIRPEQWDTGNLLPALKNLGFRLDISQGPVVVIVTISFAMISHILYRPVSHFLLL